MGEKKRNSIFVPMIVLGMIFLVTQGVMWGSPQAETFDELGIFWMYPFWLLGPLGIGFGIAGRNKERPGKGVRFLYAVEIFYASLLFISVFAKVYYDYAGRMGIEALWQAFLIGIPLFAILDAILPLLALWTSGIGCVVAAVLGDFVIRLSQLSMTWISGELDSLAVFRFFFGVICEWMFVFCITWIAKSVKKVGRDGKCKAIGTLAAMGNGVALMLFLSLVVNPLVNGALEGDQYWTFTWLHIAFPVVLCLVIFGDILLFRWLRGKKREVIRLSPETVHSVP